MFRNMYNRTFLMYLKIQEYMKKKKKSVLVKKIADFTILKKKESPFFLFDLKLCLPFFLEKKRIIIKSGNDSEKNVLKLK